MVASVRAIFNAKGDRRQKAAKIFIVELCRIGGTKHFLVAKGLEKVEMNINKRGAVLNKYFVQAENIFYEHQIFINMKKKNTETIVQYVIRMKPQEKLCKFAPTEDGKIRYQVVGKFTSN